MSRHLAVALLLFGCTILVGGAAVGGIRGLDRVGVITLLFAGAVAIPGAIAVYLIDRAESNRETNAADKYKSGHGAWHRH